MPRQIPLTQGYFAIVDDSDYEWINQWKWALARRGTMLYAYRMDWSNKKPKAVYMHRLIAGAEKGQNVDHKSGDGLDNRRCNIRLCTQAQNMKNQRLSKANTSGYKGVSFDKKKQKWQAVTWCDNKHYFLGYFAHPEDAAHAYDKAAHELFGEFARTNF